MRKSFILAALIVLSAVFVAGCSKKVDTIKLASLNPTTGAVATFGISQKNAVMLATEEWNAKGGILGKKIEMFYSDTKGEPVESATAITKAIEQDGVVGVIGPDTSSEAFSMAPIAQAKKIPMIAIAASNERVTKAGDYVFRACFIDPFQGKVMAKYLFEEAKLKSAAVLYDSGADYSTGLANVFKDNYTAEGGKIVASESYASGANDFKAQLAKIIAAKPEILYLPNFYNDVALITKQARELGFKGLFAGGDGWDSPDLVKNAGVAIEGAIFTGNFSTEDTSNGVPEFLANYKKKFGIDPDQNAALAYVASNIMFTAIKNAGGTESEALKKAITALEYDGIFGKMKFDENRNPVKSAVIIQFKDGAQHFLKTVAP